MGKGITFKTLDEEAEYLKKCKRERVAGYKTYLRVEGGVVLHKWEKTKGDKMGIITQLRNGYRLYFNPRASFAKDFVIKTYENKEEVFFDMEQFFK